MSIPRSTSYPSPSSWEAGNRSPNQRHLQVAGLRVKYIGPGAEDRDAASVCSNHPVPRDCGLYYFEIEIVTKGRDGFIGIGFSSANVKTDRLPGWEHRSYGYHGDDGHKFSGSGTGTAYGPTYTTGDIIGVVLNRAECTVSYTKNGIDLGVAFTDVADERLYPTVGMRTPDEEVLANFTGPFRYDVDSIAAEASQRVVATAMETPLPAKGKRGSLAGELIFQHLLHTGHWETAAVVARDLLDGAVQVDESDVRDMRSRQTVCSAVVAGDVDAALAMTENLAPGCLEAHPRVLFRLQCLKFVELVRQQRVEEFIEYGRSVLGARKRERPEEVELLQDTLSLMAYPEPAASPSGHLMSEPHRAELAASLNSAILTHQGRPQVSALEALWKQLIATHGELRRSGDASAALLDLNKLLATQAIKR